MSGTITDGTNAMAGVTVTIGSLSTLTDANGFYAISNLTSLSVTVVPSKVNYLFIPASRTVSLFRGDVDNVNFVRGGEIRGSVDDPTNGPVPGVTMTLTGPGTSTTTTTDADGICTFFVATGYQYTLTPSKPEYVFSPANRTTFHQANVTSVGEFLGTHVFNLYGAMMFGTQSMAGVTVRAQKGSTVKEALTDTNGAYALLDIEVGTWTVWAVLEGYSFSPATSVITGTGAPVTNVNFQLNTFEVSGRVTEGVSGLAGVLMTLGMQTTLTDSNGWYSFTNVAGAYAVFPTEEGQTFNPGARTFTAQSGLTNLNFDRGVTQVGTVTMTADRLALAAAVARGGYVQIFSAGTIPLTDTIVVSNDMVLESLSGTVTLDGANAKRLFLVETNISLTLSNLTLMRGMATNGGAVYVDGGKLTLLDCLLTRNTAAGEDGLVRTNAGDGLPGKPGAGGAIYNARGSVCVTNTVFMLNLASGGDGAKGNISGLGGNDPGGNGAVARGGAIFNDGSIFVSVCSFVSNSAAGGRGGEGAPGFSGDFATEGSDGGLGGWGHGGAIFSSGTLNVDRSTLAGNSAIGGGGGGGGRGGSTSNPFGSGGGGGNGGAAGRAVGGAIYSTNAVVHVTRSTVAQNLASGGLGGFGGSYGVGGGGLGRGGNGGNSGHAHGGGVFVQSGTMFATNVTFVTNICIAQVGGNGGTATVPDGLPGARVAGHIYKQGGTAWLRSSIVAYGTNGHCFGTISDGGRNISSDGTCAFGTDSYNNLNPMLALLANNGGRTLTAALLPGSPAIDAVNGSDCGGTDQRGRFRPSGLGCDIGAFELFQPAVITAIDPYSGAENEAVTILGSSLMDAREILFNGVSATILASTPGTVEAVVPVGATTGPVTVRTPNGDFTTATNFLVDGVAPLIAFTQPRDGSFVTHLACSGTASDVPSNIERVTLYIQRASDYAFWTGSRWGLPSALAMTFANGVWSPGAVTLPSGMQLPDGSYTLYAVAHDFARNTTTATVNVTVDKDGSETAVERLSDGTMRLQFPGTPGRTYRIEASTDLSVWQTIGSQTGPTAGILEFIDRDAANYAQRFYRTVTP